MTDLTNGDLKRTIRRAMNLEEESLQEAFVAEPKTFKQNTDKLTEANKQAHVELYQKYIAKFNEVSAMLDTADRKASDCNGSEYRSLKQQEVFNMNAIYLHELFFANIGDPQSSLHADSLTYMRFDRDWGGFDNWQADFIAAGMAASEGWVCTVFSTYLKRYINIVVDGHTQGIPVGCYPVVVVDMWAHTYYKDYLTERGKYLRKMMSQLNWKIIENRIERAERIKDALR